MVSLMAKIIWTGRTSMKVKITATAENLATGATIITNVAKFTFVALDADGNKTPVPPLLPQTEEEKQDYMDEVNAYKCRCR